MKLLVVGGAGYIGAHMCKLLSQHGHQLVVLDSLVTGHRAAIRGGEFVQASLHDPGTLERVFSSHTFDGVIHFAASIAVGESVREPLAYYRNNVGGTLNLLAAMKQHGVRRLVFSSTAAIFGNPQYSPLDEAHPTLPLNPYGHSKLMVEQILRDAAVAGHLDAVALRYFNAAGADPDGELGEAHDPETHLIPLLLKRALGQVPQMTLYGEDYPTPDGTCIRDYIHINDLCEAHLLALDYMAAGHGGFHAFNLGNGRGYSVKQVLAAAEQVVGRKIPVSYGPRRAGDSAELVASSALAREKLGWQPKIPDIQRIIETAWRWHQAPRY